MSTDTGTADTGPAAQPGDEPGDEYQAAQPDPGSATAAPGTSPALDGGRAAPFVEDLWARLGCDAPGARLSEPQTVSVSEAKQSPRPGPQGPAGARTAPAPYPIKRLRKRTRFGCWP